MTMLWLGGRQANVIETATSVTASPVADTLFPTTAAYDRHPSRIFRFGSLTAAPSITFDIDMLGGTGSFETTLGFPVGWTELNSGTGDVTQDTRPAPGGGTYAAKMAAGSGYAQMYRDVVVRSGSSFQLTAWLEVDATAILGGYLINQQTGSYWTGTEWTSLANVWALASGSAGYSQFQTEVEVEDYDTVGGAVTTLRVLFLNSVAGSDAWVDLVSLVPGVNFFSIHGHNIDPRSAPKLRSSTDNFVASDDLRATLTVSQPSLYTYLGATFKDTTGYIRYWRVQFTDTNSSTSGAIYAGEVVLGDALELLGPALPLQANYFDSQVRVPHRFGAPSVFGMAQRELRSLPLTIRCDGTDERDEFFNEWRRTIGGYPVVVVPHNGDGHGDAIYGLMSDALPHSWATKSFVSISTEIEELPFPVITG